MIRMIRVFWAWLHAPWWPLIGTVALAGIWGVSAYANFLAGMGLANSDLNKPVFGGLSVCVDVLKVIFVFSLAGAFLRRPVRWIAGLISAVLFLLCAAWSLHSAADFASASLSGVIAERGKSTNSLKHLQKELDDIVEAQPALRAVIVDRKRSDEAQRLAAKQLDDNAKRISELRPQISRSEAIDEAYPLARMTGVSDKALADGRAVFFALMLELLSTFGFWCVARARPQRVVDRPQEAAQPDLVLTASTAPVLMTKPANDARPAANVVAFPLGQRALRPQILAPERKPETARFMDESLVTAPGAEIRAADIHAYYKRWCQYHGISRPLGISWLGSHLQERYAKRDHARYRWYLDVAIKPDPVILAATRPSESLEA